MIDLFSKKVAGTWGSAPSRARRREMILHAVFGSFCSSLLKKNGESFLNVTYLNFLPAFFFDTAGAKKKAWQRRNAENDSRLRARLGAPLVDFWMLNFTEIQHRVASLTLESIKTFTRHHAFLKKATQKLSSCGGKNFHASP